MSKEIVLTGLRTNAEYHLGNYLGAILPMVDRAKNLAGKYQINMFAPDLHSFTVPIDHTKLHAQTMTNLKLFVAAGLPIDDEAVFVYRQSYIPAVSELAVILNNFAYFGELSRMIQFKEKSTQNGENVTAGLLDYPVLMAADILAYGAKWVPVGEDQTQHLEFARDIAMRMNNKFGELFVVPQAAAKQHEFVGKTQGTRIMSLRNPDNKMSKSVGDPAGTIQLSDTPKEAAKKVMSATTDSFGEIKFNPKERPGVSNLLQILSLLQGQTLQKTTQTWEGKTSYGEFKKAVAEKVSDLLTSLQNNLELVDEKVLEQKLVASETELTKVANATLLKVQQAVGLRPH